MKEALTLLLLIATSFAEPKTFDCGRIGASSSAGLQSYYDMAHGFQFEFPADWEGSEGTLFNSDFGTILVGGLFAEQNPRSYVSDGAKVTSTKVVKGLEWTALSWSDERRGYYSYRDGLAIELTALTVKVHQNQVELTPSPGVLTVLEQVLSTFAFVNDSSRLDRQIGALKTGQRLGSLTIKTIVPGTDGFRKALARVDFTGRLVLTGTVTMQTTRGSSGVYFTFEVDDSSSLQIPQLTCPFRDYHDPIYFKNGSFAQRQFGMDWDDRNATVVLDRVSEAFYNGGTGAWIRARLVEVRH